MENDQRLSQILAVWMREFDELVDGYTSITADEKKKRLCSLRIGLENLNHIVGNLSMFSKNEVIEDISTESLRFLLIPALLGVTVQLDDDVTSRVATLRSAEAYLRYFFELMQLYDIEKLEIEKSTLFQTAATSTSANVSLDALANTRKTKISRLKHTNELRQQLQELNKRIIGNDMKDEDLARELHMTELKYWANRALDELDSVKKELTLHEQREKHLSASNGDSEQTAAKNIEPAGPAQSFKPLLLTRNEAQKKVFGAGYPSLPTMTVDEWFDEQVREGRIPSGFQYSKVNQAHDSNSAETEAIVREYKVETDDAAELKRLREWDEYKDVNRRGWGNTHNKG